MTLSKQPLESPTNAVYYSSTNETTTLTGVPINTNHIRPLVALAVLLVLGATSAPAPKRPLAQIQADIQAASGTFPHYDFDTRLDRRYRAVMAKEVIPPLRRRVDLFAELEAAYPAETPKVRSVHCLDLAELALDGDADALKTLTDASHSAKPADAAFGSMGLLAYHDLKQFLAQNKNYNWPQSFSPAGPNRYHNLAEQCGISAIPTTYVIDRNGILRNIAVGYLPEKEIKQLLDQPATSAPSTKPSTP